MKIEVDINRIVDMLLLASINSSNCSDSLEEQQKLGMYFDNIFDCVLDMIGIPPDQSADIIDGSGFCRDYWYLNFPHETTSRVLIEKFVQQTIKDLQEIKQEKTYEQ